MPRQRKTPTAIASATHLTLPSGVPPKVTDEEERAYRRRYRLAARRTRTLAAWLESEVRTLRLPDMGLAMAAEDVERVARFLDGCIDGTI